MIWSNLLHIYQPPNWDKKIIKKVAKESYQPILNILEKNPAIKITLNINASLTEQLVACGYKNIINQIKNLAQKEQIEFTHSAKFHLILPLYSLKTIERQIRLNQKTNLKYFGKVYQPKGFFPPEMAWHNKLIPILKKFAIEWVALDEICARGDLGKISFDQGYQSKKENIKFIFRNRKISDYFIFEPETKNINKFFSNIKKEKRGQKILISAMDGENLGHHRPGADKIWQKLMTNKKVKSMNYTSLLKEYNQFKKIKSVPGSWSSEVKEIKNNIPYALWKNHNNPIHKIQWQLNNKVISLFKLAKKRKDKNIHKTQKMLDRALASDKFWWASMRPWWDYEIIIRESKELYNVILALESLKTEEKKSAKKIFKELKENTTKYEKQGLAKENIKKYLNKIGFIPKMGGEKII
ncbi:MAG: hypothetical protein U5L76_04435 [Patescibacteria group bacterium]|nr:hypothetical protein [Patescibacteria group bacterium]